MNAPQPIKMHNLHVVGIHGNNMDRFSLRGCFLVIGAFGVITLISYFNELAKAGLLSGHQRFRTAEAAFTLKRDSHNFGEQPQGEQVLLKKDGGLHQLDLNLLPFQREQKQPTQSNATKEDRHDESEEIQIALRLGKDDEYQRANKSSTSIYQYHNVLPNFYMSINSSLAEVDVGTSNFTLHHRKSINNFTRNVLHKKVKTYRNDTGVLIYQHDPDGYALRDCLLALSMDASKVLPPAPLNAMYRKSWESMNRDQKSKFDILYGGLSFGVCESMSKECSYAAIISHPLDRLLQVYALCKKNSSITMCRFLEMSNVSSIRGFLEHHGSSFFQKLLYYSRHCRLVGQDEVCIHDSNVYFVLSFEEKQEYLKDILQNVEKWFSVVGLVEQLPLSLSFLHTVLGLKFGDCLGAKMQPPKKFYSTFHSFHQFHRMGNATRQSLDIDGVPYFEIREKLLKDEEVNVWLSADMAIYDKFVEIFNKQLSVQKQLKKLMHKYYQEKQKSKKNSSGRNVIIGETSFEKLHQNTWKKEMPLWKKKQKIHSQLRDIHLMNEDINLGAFNISSSRNQENNYSRHNSGRRPNKKKRHGPRKFPLKQQDESQRHQSKHQT